MVGMRSGLPSLSGDAHIAVGAVLEADRTGKSGSEFAMNLAFGCTRADGCPRNQIGYELGRRHIEEFGRRRQTKIVPGGKHVAGETKALVNDESAIQDVCVDTDIP